jgi:xanthine dehydrogenase/oxidase
MAGSVTFFLNGEPVTLEDPPPDLLLIDYVRSPEVGLTGAKKGCGQGGCGACTVILSRWDEPSGRVEHVSINSCLRPVCALGGLAITTIEGTGAPVRPAPGHLSHRLSFSRGTAPPLYAPPAVAEAAQVAAASLSSALENAGAPQAGGGGAAGDRAGASQADGGSVGGEGAGASQADGGSVGGEGINPVAYRLAINNGTQCGYCTAGFVMNMSALLVANTAPTKREIEDVFDGNLCRCTGFRAILTGMKTFASDWTAEDEANRMKCLPDQASQAQFVPDDITIDLPAGAEFRGEPVEVSAGARTWLTPTTIDELCAVMRDNADGALRLVHGNTSFGIYPEEFLAADVLVDVNLIPELGALSVDDDGIHAGAGVTYRALVETLAAMGAQPDGPTPGVLGALDYMALRTAGTIVRNAASLGGNSMLVLAHIAQGTGEPFPSDLMTALAAIGAQVEYARASTGERSKIPVEELVAAALDDPAFVSDLVLIAYDMPVGGADIVLAQKVALREVNAHSLVNTTTRLRVGADLSVEQAILVFGGIAPFPWRARRTEEALAGQKLSLGDFPRLAEVLGAEVQAELDRWRSRMAGLPSEGITDAYRVDLAVGFLYKALVNALLERAPESVPPDVRSSGKTTWGRWPTSDGTQHYEIQPWKAPVSQPYVKLMALYQAMGRIHYTHEIALPPTAVNAAFVQSKRALAEYFFATPDKPDHATADDVRDYLRGHYPSFVDLVTHEQIPPHGVNFQGMGSDQPLLAVDQVRYVGQAIALVIAETEQEAIAIAEHASEHCVGYTPVDWPARRDKPPWDKQWDKPILSLDQAIGMGSVFPDYPSSANFVSHVWRITRPGSRLDWVAADKDPLDKEIAVRTAAVDGVECSVVETTQACGGQVHFYMETQACVAIPLDGDRLAVLPSTQSPGEMHDTVAMALGVEHHRVEVVVPPVGGAYGGKTEQARFVAGPTAVAARALGRPVRLAMKREHDTAMIGKRHAYYGQCQVALDTGEGRPADRGLIRGFHSKMWGDGGAFYDCSFIVSNCIQLRVDNAYRVANFENQIDVCRTNTAPSTAMRAFGDIQGKLITENAIDDAAFALGLAAEEVRERNFYERGDVTPFGQALSYCYMKDVWAYLKEVAAYDEKRAAVDAFNAENTWRKRGIAMVPVKYGSGYNFLQLEQAVAYVAVNAADGSVLIHQGGVEMGQGLMTVVEQVASYILNVPSDLLHIESPNTGVIPNPTSTGASTGTPYNAAAVKQACETLRERLTEFGYQMLKDNGQAWCAKNQIDFWSYGETGWASEVQTAFGPKLIWQNLISQAHAQRVSLTASFTAPIRGGETPVPALTFKPMDEQVEIPGIEVDKKATPGGAVDSFTGFTYSAACSVVEVDVLTGEVKVISSDLMYDLGWSLNPAIDVGQVEGAFVQGLGYVLSENLVHQPDGEDEGALTTLNTWRYKIPATTTIPLELNTYLFPRDRVPHVPDNPNELFSAKEVGEPPLVLATSAFFAVKHAVRASRLQRGLDGLFRLDAPATVQEVRRACAISSEHMDEAAASAPSR